MDEPIYVSTPLDEYIDLTNLRDFFYVLKDFGIEKWENWDQALAEFLDDEGIDELPY